MEKNMNKVEETEIKEEVKMEELSEEILDEANGGVVVTGPLIAYLILKTIYGRK